MAVAVEVEGQDVMHGMILSRQRSTETRNRSRRSNVREQRRAFIVRSSDRNGRGRGGRRSGRDAWNDPFEAAKHGDAQPFPAVEREGAKARLHRPIFRSEWPWPWRSKVRT